MPNAFRFRRILAAAGLLAWATTSLASAALTARLSVDKAWLGENDDVIATVVVTNDSNRVAWVPKAQLPEALLTANLFEVTRNGEAVAYLGRLAKRPMPRAQDYVALRPGGSISGSTELSSHYDIADGGEYLVSYRMNLMNKIEMAELGADELASSAVSIWRDAPVRSRVVDWERLADLAAERRPGAEALSTSGCTSSRASSISSAFSSATSYSTAAKNYLNGKTYSTVGARYTSWFGAKNSTRFNTVKGHYTAIENAFLTKAVTVDCACTDDYYAYVYANQPYRIWVCNAFWSAPTTGTDSKAGTLVHEMSHFNVVAGTDDWAYGQSACRSLANSNAKRAVDNADSHEYFAENTPAQN
jgi:peptidyl-Lys metalloendopeptidase